MPMRGSVRFCVSYRYKVHAPAQDRTAGRSDVSRALAARTVLYRAFLRIEVQIENEAVGWAVAVFVLLF